MLKYAILAVMIINGIIFAQQYSKSQANISARLVNGAALSVVNEEYPNMVNPQILENKSEGILFRFTGINLKDVIITCTYSIFHERNSTIENYSNARNESYIKLISSSDKEFYFLIDNSNSSLKKVDDKIHQQICHVSLVYN